jgi:class 3 adenylate cyclase
MARSGKKNLSRLSNLRTKLQHFKDEIAHRPEKAFLKLFVGRKAHPAEANSGQAAEDLKEERQLAAIIFTDMVGYSALMQKDEALAIELIEEHRQLLRPLFTKHSGREIETVGDAFLVEFDSAVQAARCAVDIQQSLHERNRNVDQSRWIQLRIGIHMGDVIHKGGRVYGDGVNIAARIEPLADPGGICVSEDVARQLQNKAGILILKLGRHDLKNIAMEVDLYKILLPWDKEHV